MKTIARQPRSPVPRLVRVGMIFASIAAALGLVSMIVVAVLKVRGGSGLETYHTVWLVEDNWIGFLVFFLALVVALSAAVIAVLAFRRRERQEWSELEQKYGGGRDGA